MSRLLILAPRELTGDARARRQAVAGRDGGWDVVGLCVRQAGEDPAPLDGVPIVRVDGDRLSGALRRAGLGGMRRSRPPARELRGLWRLARLAKISLRLARGARRLEQFDVVHANDFDSLPAAWLIARRSGARLVYDAHELYADMETDPPRLYRLVASALEGALARRAGAVVTNCDLFADVLTTRFRLPRRAIVVLNAPDRLDSVTPPEKAPRLRVIYQAAADHPGRPVADAVHAAAEAADIELTIRVVELDREAIERLIGELGVADRVHVVEPVPLESLLQGLLGHDVGLLINRPLTLNTELAVPGKIFEYMMAGLAVVAPRLPGLVALVEGDGVGALYEPGSPQSLGRVLQSLADDRERLDAMRARARELALERYNAETQVEALERAWALPS